MKVLKKDKMVDLNYEDKLDVQAVGFLSISKLEHTLFE